LSRLRFLHLAVAAVIVGFVVWKAGTTDIRRALEDMNPRLFAAALALNLPLLALFPLRSHFVLRRLGARVPPRVLIPASILGSIAGSMTPASSGELLRTAVLRTHADLAIEDGLALVAYERVLSLWMLTVGTAASAPFFVLDRPLALAVSASLLPLFGAPIVARLLLIWLPAADDDPRPGKLAAIVRSLQRVATRLRLLLGDLRLLSIWSLITVMMFAIATAQLWLLSRSLSHSINPGEAWVAFGASQLAAIASLLPFGLGSLDGSLAAILHKFGLTLEQGAATALLLRLAVTIPYAIIALACYVYLQRIGSTTTGAPADTLA
jgi:uncharacterized membrane protein YbhN (UPF0104 family)